MNFGHGKENKGECETKLAYVTVGQCRIFEVYQQLIKLSIVPQMVCLILS